MAIRPGRLKVAALLGLVPASIIAATLLLPDYRLLRRGIPIDGVVHHTEPTNHNSVYYGYQYQGRSYQYSSQGGAGLGNPSMSALKPGTHLRLWLDPHDPSRALPGDPRASLKNNLAFVIPAYFMFVFFFYRSFPHLPGMLRLGED